LEEVTHFDSPQIRLQSLLHQLIAIPVVESKVPHRLIEDLPLSQDVDELSEELLVRAQM
jgi:hypothetical protein